MDWLARFLERPPDDLLGGSVDQQTRSETPRRSGLILLGLLLWCLVPRALMLFRIGAVCDDGYYYITMADSLRRGDFETAFYYLNLNVYPAVLLALHGAGLEWVLAGKLWGLLISSLVVLPTFGWIRRLFDDRIAIAACFLYGIHPELIEFSIEPIRDPTFWFLLNLSLYLTYRAVAERKWRLFALAGLAVSLAIHTRVEGWFLVGAVLLWPLFHWKSAHRVDRFRLASGTFLCLGVTPVLLVAVNMTLLRHHERWEWGRLSQFQTCWEWIRPHQNTNGPRPATTVVPVDETAASPPPAKILHPLMPTSRTVAVAGPSSENGTMQNRAAAEVAGHPSKPLSTLAVSPPSPASDSSPSNAAPMSFSSWHVRKYFKELFDTMEPVNSLFLLIGLIAGRRALLQREKSILAFLSLAVLWGVWIRLWSSGDMNGRYFFTFYLLLLPFEAIGLLVVLRYLTELVARRTSIRLRPVRPAATLLFLLAVVFWADALSSRHVSREAEMALGSRLQNAYGPFGTVLVDNRGARIGYYAQGDIPAVRFNYQPLEPMIDQHHPDLLILSKKESTPIQRDRLLEKTIRLGYRPVRFADQTAAAENDFILLVRRPGERPMVPTRNDRQAARLPVTRQ